MSNLNLSPVLFSVRLCLGGCAALSLTACDGPGETEPTCGTLNESAAVEHSGTIAADEVWSQGLHVVTSTVTVGAATTLTLDRCAVVRMAPDASIAVDDEAIGLIATGTANQPVTIERTDDAAAWGALVAFAPATIELHHTTVSGGGGTISDIAAAEHAGASIVVRNQTDAVVDQLLVDNVLVEGSTGVGIMLQHTGFVADSEGLTVRGAGAFPVYVGAGYATHLPAGRYDDNGFDMILLQSVGAAAYDNTEAILHDATLPSRGVPYLVGTGDARTDIRVGDSRPESPAATLTIEPGVEVQLLGEVLVTGKVVDGAPVEQGALVAVGTADAPIVFTSARPARTAGDWVGLSMRVKVAAATRVEHVEIRYAGGDSQTTGRCVAAVGAENNDADCGMIVSVEEAPHAFFANSVVSDSAGCGVYRGWFGDVVDFTSSNSFENVAGCEQSNVPTDEGSCDTGSCQ